MRLIKINDTYINPMTVAFIQHEPPHMVDDIPLGPARKGWILIHLTSGRTIGAQMDINEAVDKVNAWLAGK